MLDQEDREELEDQLDFLENDLILMEHDGGKDFLDDAFRQAHSIKGSASMLGLTNLSALAHKVEDRLDQMRITSTTTYPIVVVIRDNDISELLDMVDQMRDAFT